MIHADRPTLLMLVGLPGSGKSTRVSEWRDQFDFALLSTDDFIENAAKEQGLSYDDVFSREIKRASHAMRQDLKDALSNDRHIVWDQTNVAPKGRKKKLKGIPDRYYKVAVVFDVDDAELERRLAKRAEETGKSIPPHVLRSMSDSFLYPTREEGFDKVIKGN